MEIPRSRSVTRKDNKYSALHRAWYDPILLCDSPSKPQHPACVIALYRCVKLYVLPEKSGKMKTTVKKNTTDPVYNEVFKVKRSSYDNKFGVVSCLT